MNNKKIYHFIENTLSLFSVKAIDLVIAIFLIPYLILKVGIENYGVYAFAIALVFFFMNISNYGFNLVAVRELAKPEDKRSYNSVFNEVFSVKLFIIVFLLLLLVILNFIVPSFRSHSLLYVFASFLLLSDLFSLRWFFIGVEKMKFLPIISLVATLIYALLVILFINEPKDYIYIILFEAIGLLVAGGISFFYVIQEYELSIKILSFKKVSAYLYNNFSSFINLFVPSVLSNLAVLLVGMFSIPIHVSYMQLGVKFSNAFSTVNSIVTKVFYPIVNRDSKVRKISVRTLLIMGVLFSVVMFFSADLLVKPWLKLDNEESINQVTFIIKIMSPTPLLMSIISAYGVNGLLVLGKDKLFGFITISSVLVGLLIGALGFINYGYLGAAIFLIAARFVYALLSFWLFTKKTAHSTLKK
ncbi:oligosaccharide flippase family protein [Lutibacter citreus]|uniref:oligosaccharide flippase family protein n=1 Tax=Lutibacter citreus TaxID=2138210 RepID=UPI0013004838|nr:oligosaccharide flippase family protein [Lutibacter citreus]